jgi:tetratricopeptide (TPR) repeat protein
LKNDLLASRLTCSRFSSWPTAIGWSGSDDMAIEAASRILQYDANDFAGLKLLSEIYAERDESERAAEFVRRALDNYPKSLPPAPRKLISVTRFLARILPPLRRLGPKDFAVLEDPNATNRVWFEWAKQYLAWYDAATGGSSSPVLH